MDMVPDLVIQDSAATQDLVEPLIITNVVKNSSWAVFYFYINKRKMREKDE
jgi:hypothetical protein